MLKVGCERRKYNFCCVCTVVGVKRRISTDSEYEDEDDEVVVKRVKVEPVSEDDGEVSGVRRIEKVTPSRGRGRPPGKLRYRSNHFL